MTGRCIKQGCASSATSCRANSAALRRPCTVLTALVAAALAMQHQLLSTHTHSPPPQAAIEGSGVGKLRITPVLLQKGGTRVSAAAAALGLTSPPVLCGAALKSVCVPLLARSPIAAPLHRLRCMGWATCETSGCAASSRRRNVWSGAQQLPLHELLAGVHIGANPRPAVLLCCFAAWAAACRAVHHVLTSAERRPHILRHT